MTPEYAFVAVGSNRDPLNNIPRAFDLLRQTQQGVASSTFYQTEPIGPPGQPAFMNGVWLIQTTTPPLELQDQLHQIEAQLGRVRTTDKYAPRVIDLDLILYGQEQYHTQALALPHPDVSRPFVLNPILELIACLHLEGFHEHLPKSPAVPREFGQPLPELTEQLRQYCHP